MDARLSRLSGREPLQLTHRLLERPSVRLPSSWSSTGSQSSLSPQLLEENHDTLLWLATEAEKRNIWLMFQFYNITSPDFARAHGLPCGNSDPTLLLAGTRLCIEKFVSEFPSIGLYICPGEALRLQYTDGWINDVIPPAVNRTGRNPPIMIRAWGIDLPHMAKVAGHYTPLHTERKYNVEMLASDHVDPENLDWSRDDRQHVVNVHCIANLEPFRWSPPSHIQRCLQSSSERGGYGLHLYPRKAWRWPYGCDLPDATQVQWKRDWMWFEAWSRYAWNPDLDPGEEQVYWSAPHRAFRRPVRRGKVLASQEAARRRLAQPAAADLAGGDNHHSPLRGILSRRCWRRPARLPARARDAHPHLPRRVERGRLGRAPRANLPRRACPRQRNRHRRGQVLDLVARRQPDLHRPRLHLRNAVPPEFIGLPTIRFSNDEGKRGQARIRFRCDEPVRVFVAFNRPSINWADPPAKLDVLPGRVPVRGRVVGDRVARVSGGRRVPFSHRHVRRHGIRACRRSPPAPGQTPVEFMAELVDAARRL
ncbi:hypothetical protein HS125_18390 [bacterium]|nr:hypothetical protein [bacterium]